MKTSTALLVAAGGLGLVFLATRKKDEGAPSPTPPAPSPAPGPAPAQREPARLPPGLLSMDALRGQNVHLRQGSWYRGRLDASSPLPPFTPASSREEISLGLQGLGFKNVEVYNLAPATWPPEVSVGAASTTRWFYGQWSMMTGDLPRPPNLELLWVAPSPELIASRRA